MLWFRDERCFFCLFQSSVSHASQGTDSLLFQVIQLSTQNLRIVLCFTYVTATQNTFLLKSNLLCSQDMSNHKKKNLWKFYVKEYDTHEL